jgi:hypothetical protein
LVWKVEEEIGWVVAVAVIVIAGCWFDVVRWFIV